jgi:hypothetical protein
MTVMTGRLHRHKDMSGVSGTGDVAWFCEFPDGAVAVRWPGEHPSMASWGDMRDVEYIHGHQGATEIMIDEPHRLVRAYQRVVPWMLSARYADRPFLCAPHPDHPDRLRLVYKDERAWRFWIALLDGSTDAATHTEVSGEIQHQWIDPEGDLWLTYYTPTATTKHDPIHDPRD